MITENLTKKMEPGLVFEGWIGFRCMDRSREGSLEEGNDVNGMVLGF